MADLPSTNGKSAHHDDPMHAVAQLRVQPRNVSAFRGFGPLVAGVVLFVLMLWLAPSVAPEHIVDKPVNSTTTTVVSTTTTTAAPN